MAKLLRLRRGTTTQHGSFTGAEGEVTVDTDKDTLVVHDNATAGGRPMLREDLNNMPASGVTAGTYGSSSAIPAITVDAKGRVTSATTSAIDSTSIANGTSNVSVAASGNITVTRGGSSVGTFGASGLGFNDNVKTTFGDGDDLQIYHDGTKSVIEDVGTGSLFIKATDLVIRSATNEDYLDCTANGAVRLYHDNSVKLATTSSGIDVTGNIECDGGNVTGQLNVNKLVVDDDGSTSPTMVVKSDDNSITGFVVKNDTYSTNEEIGFKINQGNDGTVQVMNVGNSEYKGINFQTLNGAGGVKNAIVINPEASVDLYYNNGVKLQTESGGINVTGTVNCDGLTSEGQMKVSLTNDPQLIIQDADHSGTAVESAIAFTGSNNATNGRFGFLNSSDDNLDIVNSQNGDIRFATNDTYRCYVSAAGHFVPILNNTYDLGSSSQRWRNVYTNDLNLSNEGGANDVDGTWGSWTIQEGEDELFLLNRRNGKKYKFNLSEVN